MEELNAIQDEASSLEEFLQNQDLRDRYLQAAQNYHGGAEYFPAVSYNAILAQVAELAAQDRRIAERAWGRTPLGRTFSVQVQGQNQFRFDHARWMETLQTTRERVRQKSGVWASWWKDASLSAAFVTKVAELEIELRGLLSQNGYSKEMLQNWITSNESFIAALLSYQLETEDHLEGLQSSTWETVAAVTNKIAQNSTLEWGGFFPQNPQLIKYWKFMEPTFLRTARSAAQYGTFESTTSNRQEIIFRAARPFLALFRGLSIKECTAGDCSLLAGLSPRRYGIALLNETWVQIVEENNVAAGHIQGVLIQDSNSRVVMNVDMMSGKLRRVISDPTTSESTLIFDLWLSELHRLLPAGVMGVAIGESLNANNEKMQEFARQQKSYLLGVNLGPANRFSVRDTDMAYRISSLGWRLEKEHHYGNCLTFDACDAKSGQLRLLNPSLTDRRELSLSELTALWNTAGVQRQEVLKIASREVQIAIAIADSEGFVATLVAMEIPADAANQYVEYLRGNPASLGEGETKTLKATQLLFVRRGLGTLARGSNQTLNIQNLEQMSDDEILEFKALLPAQRAVILQGYLKDHLGRFTGSNFDTFVAFMNLTKGKLPPAIFNDFLEAAVAFAANHFKIINWIQVRRLREMTTTIESDVVITTAFHRKMSDIQSLMSLLSPAVGNPSDAYKIALSKLVPLFTPHFISLKPNASQILAWLKLSNYVNDSTEARRILMSHQWKPREYQIILRNEYGYRKGSDAFKTAMARFFADNWKRAADTFTRLDHYETFLAECYTVELCLEIRRHALRFVTTPQEFVTLFSPIKNATDQFIRALAVARSEYLDVFLETNPTKFQLVQLFFLLPEGNAKQRVSQLIDSHVSPLTRFTRYVGQQWRDWRSANASVGSAEAESPTSASTSGEPVSCQVLLGGE